MVNDPVASAGDAAALRSTSITPLCVDAVFALFAGENPLVGGYFRAAAATASTAAATASTAAATASTASATASTASATATASTAATTGGGDEAVESDIDGALVVVVDGGDGADMMMLI